VFSFFSHIGSTFLPILTRMGVAQFLAFLGTDLRSPTMPLTLTRMAGMQIYIAPFL